MSDRTRSPLAGYGVAALAVMIATLLRIPLQGTLGDTTPFLFFFPAIVFSGWSGGFKPGLLATLLSGFVAPFFFVEPRFSFNHDTRDLINVGLFLIAGTFISLINEAWHRARRRAEESKGSERRQRDLLQITLSSIGDAVIATDDQGRITFMNPVAQSLTAWKEEEARGKPLAEIFNIVNELTREKVEDPVAKVLRLNSVVGLANHTILLAKDGREIPIDDSGAPIRDNKDNIIGVVLVFRDITERKGAEQSKAILTAIVESSDSAIIGKKLDGTIISWNRGAERLYGYSPEEAIGQPISMLIPPDMPDELPKIMERLKCGEVIDSYETVRRCKDGNLIDILLTVSPINDSEGNVIGASALARNITEQKRVQKERELLLAREQAAREEAEAASRAKDELLATISHELRTPLNAILGWIGMLRSGRLDDDTKARALETLDRNARSQAQLIEDMLEVSRIVTGKLRLDVQPVELSSVIQLAVDAVRPAADAKGVRLQTLLDPNAGPVSGDPNRLQQVVWNLLSNGVKFTPKGGRVQIRLERINSHVQIAVSDTGQGISSEFLPFVFERFRQADSSLSRKHGGLGLGLAIVRHLVELHGGTVEAMSEGEGQGSTFFVKLPVIIVYGRQSIKGGTGLATTSSGRQPSPESMPSLIGLRLLVIEDEADARELALTMLRECGAEVKAVATVNEAIDTLKGWKPDVLVSDIEMPVEDGYSFIRRVRSADSDSIKRIPAIALTAHVRGEDRVKALSEGFDAHVSKPVELTELATVIISLARRSKG